MNQKTNSGVKFSVDMSSTDSYGIKFGTSTQQDLLLRTKMQIVEKLNEPLSDNEDDYFTDTKK